MIGNVEQLKYFGKTLTNQNSIYDEIKSILNSGKACYHLVQNLLCSNLLSKSVKIKRTIIVPVLSFLFTYYQSKLCGYFF